MKKVILFFTILLLVTFVGCSSISTNTDYDPTVDFTKYKTYMWYAGEMPADDELGKYPLVKKRIANSVEKSLQAKGYTKGTQENYDFVIILHAGTKEKMQMNSYNYGGYGYGRGWGGYGGGMSTTDVNYYDEATLIVDLHDAATKELAWRGTATGVVGSGKKTQEEAQTDADDIINKIMADFPPEKEK